jgi:ribosome maturation factor RimP
MELSTVVKIQGMIEPVLRSLGYELVEVQLRTEQNGLILRIIIHQDAGITVNDCSVVSREIGQLLEVEDVISRAYHLEVSSPGLDRPLKTERDFTRNIGKKVKVITADGEQKKVVIGKIKGCAGDVVEIDAGNDVQGIPLSAVAKAKLVIEF